MEINDNKKKDLMILAVFFLGLITAVALFYKAVVADVINADNQKTSSLAQSPVDTEMQIDLFIGHAKEMSESNARAYFLDAVVNARADNKVTDNEYQKIKGLYHDLRSRNTSN